MVSIQEKRNIVGCKLSVKEQMRVPASHNAMTLLLLAVLFLMFRNPGFLPTSIEMKYVDYIRAVIDITGI